MRCRIRITNPQRSIRLKTITTWIRNLKQVASGEAGNIQKGDLTSPFFIRKSRYDLAATLRTSIWSSVPSTISRTPSAILLRARATERREPSTLSARSAAMVLMDSRSSEALARRASASMSGFRVNRPPRRGAVGWWDLPKWYRGRVRRLRVAFSNRRIRRGTWPRCRLSNLSSV